MQSKNAVRNQYTNLYAYAANNPVHYIDPDGRQTKFSCLVPDDSPKYWNMNVGSSGASPNSLSNYCIPPLVAGAGVVLSNNYSKGFTPRDKEGNPIPAGNQSGSPLGKGANKGPENLPDIGNFGDPGNEFSKLPNGKGPKFKITIGFAAIGLLLDNCKDLIDVVCKKQDFGRQCDAISGAAPSIKAKKEMNK